jgi:hypothetical protein
MTLLARGSASTAWRIPHAVIQVLNTAQFPVNAGPLSQVHR